eukprot:7763366-Lingulodinium_polyedra.AAC.1
MPSPAGWGPHSGPLASEFVHPDARRGQRPRRPTRTALPTIAPRTLSNKIRPRRLGAVPGTR